MKLPPVRLLILFLAFLGLAAWGGARLYSAEALPFVAGMEMKLGWDRVPVLGEPVPAVSAVSQPVWARELENSFRLKRLLSTSA